MLKMNNSSVVLNMSWSQTKAD